MNNTPSLLTPALQAYLIALIYRNTRTNCLSLAALCSWVWHYVARKQGHGLLVALERVLRGKPLPFASS
ncbi:MAG TPA: hypothetical protein VJ464_14815 [Blastocatellia bacterium]|nr:hypothetical protein [Blastocatellia bacterium]